MSRSAQEYRRPRERDDGSENGTVGDWLAEDDRRYRKEEDRSETHQRGSDPEPGAGDGDEGEPDAEEWPGGSAGESEERGAAIVLKSLSSAMRGSREERRRPDRGGGPEQAYDIRRLR